MKNLRSTISLICSISCLLLCIWLVFGKAPSPKIAYVRSSDLIYSYLGMKEAQGKYQQKTQLWQANIDTLQQDLQLAVSRYNTEAPNLSPEEREVREKNLQSQQNNLIEYTKSINEKARQEDQKITDGVLNQINSFVEKYGRDNGYEIILGTTLSGNLLYGDNTIDITDEVLSQLNKSYTDQETLNDENGN